MLGPGGGKVSLILENATSLPPSDVDHYEPEGREFESLRAHHIFQGLGDEPPAYQKSTVGKIADASWHTWLYFLFREQSSRAALIVCSIIHQFAGSAVKHL
jgi:hypothetical protein